MAENMTHSQSVSESLRKSTQFLETQPGFHRDKVPGFKEAVESVIHLPMDEDFSVRLLEDLRQFQGFHIVQFSKIISLIEELCVTSSLNFQSEVKKFLEMCQRKEMAMDISVFLEIVLDILSSEEATENTVNSLDSTTKELDILYSELVRTGGVHLRETDNACTSQYCHPSSSFLECYHVLKRRFHKEGGDLLIMATSSLIGVDKSRDARIYCYSNCYQGSILRAWVKLLRTPYVSNNLALLIAEMERDQYNTAVELLDQKQLNAEDQGADHFPIILPNVVAAIDKLNSHAKDQEPNGDVIFQMMQVPGSFDTDLNNWTKTKVSRAEMEEKWKTLFKNTVQWNRFPVELTRLIFETSLTSKDFDLIFRFSAFLRYPGEGLVVYLCNRIVNNRKSCTSTIDVVKLLMNVSENKESVCTSVINLMKIIDDLTEKEGVEADERTTDIIRIFIDLRFLWQDRSDCRFYFSDLIKCLLEKVPVEDLEMMVNALHTAAKNGIAAPSALWQVLVSIYCNKGISNKTGLWDKYLYCLSSTQSHQYRICWLSEALGLLAEENAFLLLDQVLSDPLCACFLSEQVHFFSRIADGDVNSHYSLVSSVIQGTAGKTELIAEQVERINAVISSSRRSPIPGTVYDALVVAVAGSVAVGTYNAMMDDYVSRCVAHALCEMSHSIEVMALYLEVKFLLGRASKFSVAFHGDRTVTMCIQSSMLCFPVGVSVTVMWMNAFVNCTELLFSNGGSVSQKMSLLWKFCDAVFREGVLQPQELQNSVENFLIPVDQKESDEKRSLAFQLMEAVLDVPNILNVLGKILTKEKEVSKEVRPPEADASHAVVPIKHSFVSLILEKFSKSIETRKALEIYQFVSTLDTKNYFHLLLPVCLAAVENLTEVQDFLEELRILTSILMDAPLALLPLAANCLVVSYQCKMTMHQRKSFLDEIMQIQGISMDLHMLLKTSELFGKGWQQFGVLQRLIQRLRSVLRHLDEAMLSRCLTPATLEQSIHSIFQGGHPLGTAAREKDLFCEGFHWLLLETDLCPADIALCIKLSLRSFDSHCGMLQGRSHSWFISDATEEDENIKSDEFTSPIRVVCNFLLALRSTFGVDEMEEHLLERLLKTVFEGGWLTCSLRKGSFAVKLVIRDALNLVTVSKTRCELLLWLESPKLLSCGHTMNAVMEAFNWRKQEMSDTECESRMDISCKVKTLLEKMMNFRGTSCVEVSSTDRMIKLLQLNLRHKLSVKILDLFVRNENAALACGKILLNWQSVDEGLKLLKKFISLWPEERNPWHGTHEDFEFTHLLLDVPLQLSLKSAEQVLQLWNQLQAQRKLQEHYPLQKAAQWIQTVTKSKISPEISSSWLAIFRIAQSKYHDVSVITDLTPEVMDVLTPGSTCITDCLFSFETVNKILLSSERVDEKELKIALTLARLLNELSTLAQLFQKDTLPCNEVVMETLREASYELCKSFQEKIRAVQKGSGNCNTSKRTSCLTAETGDTRLPSGVFSRANHDTSFLERESTAKLASSRYDSSEVGSPFLVKGVFSDSLRNTNVTQTSFSHGKDSGIVLAGNAGLGLAHGSRHQRTSKVSTKDLYRVSRHYQKKVFVQMSGSWGFNALHPDSVFAGNKKILEGLLLLLRRWLVTIAQPGAKKPTMKSHVDKILNLVHHANRLPAKSQLPPGHPADKATNPLWDTAERSTHQVGSCSSPDSTSTSDIFVADIPPAPVGHESAVHKSIVSPTTAAAVAATGTAKTQATVPVSAGVVTSSALKTTVAGCGTDALPDVCQDSCTIERSFANQKRKAAPPSTSGEDRHTGQHSSAQEVQDYVFNLDSNQACIARLQRAGYNQCDTSDVERPVNLWYDSCITLTGSIGKRQDNRDREAKRQLRNHCNEYLDLLRNVEIQTVDVDGESIRVRNLFAQKLSWDEMTKQIDVVREKLQQSLPEDDRGRYKHLVKREKEMRENLAILYSPDKFQKPQEENAEQQVFTVLWENRFFEAIKLCSENIPGCYAPSGFHSHKPIQCALCADSRIISVFKEMGAHRKEVENVEVKLLEAGMFVFGLHSSQLEMDTDELWAAFYKSLLERRLVPRIILSEDSPALEWTKQFVGADGDEKLDASQMKFHETVIPKEESCYDFHPYMDEVDGKSVYSAALVLNSENVKHFVFSDIKLRDPSATVTKERGRKLTGEVMRELKQKRRDKFDDAHSQRLLRRLACSVQKVCDQVVKENLSETEMKKNLEEEIDEKKLYTNIEVAGEMGLEWFVDAIVDSVRTKSGPKQDA